METDLDPDSIHETDVLTNTSQYNYMYIDGIRFIKKLKYRAPFAETSPMLNDISQLSSWERVYKGLLKLYQGEVLNKFPVAQHIMFGKIFRFEGEVLDSGDVVGGDVGDVGAVGTNSNTTNNSVTNSTSSLPMEATKAPWATNMINKHVNK